MLTLTQLIEILNGGFRLNKKMYVSFGLYQEMDFIGYFPDDIANSLHTMETDINVYKTVQFSQLRFKGDALGVITCWGDLIR